MGTEAFKLDVRDRTSRDSVCPEVTAVGDYAQGVFGASRNIRNRFQQRTTQQDEG